MNIRVGVLLEPQLTTYPSYIDAVRQAESIGVDSIWNWDHFIPPYRKGRGGNHLEAWTLLSAVAACTQRVELGTLVNCVHYRNPALLATMAKTLDHISSGRLTLGIGAGWLEREYQEYGYPYPSAGERLQDLENAIPVIRERWKVEDPKPVRGSIPLLIGGDGEKVTLRIAAQYADLWNGFDPPEVFQHKNQVLNQWCEKIGRDPATIERSVITHAASKKRLDALLEAGAQHIILSIGEPWNISAIEKLVRWRRSLV